MKAAAIVGATGLTAGSLYSLNRGIRYPTLSLESLALPTRFTDSNNKIQFHSPDLIELSKGEESIHFRTFSAEPSVKIVSTSQRDVWVSVNNIHPRANLITDRSESILHEKVTGITRAMLIRTNSSSELNLSWRLPFQADYKFASIGDSGGDKELEWCIQRAHALGAEFLLHLGDFNYQAGDYQRSITLFQNSPIPVFVSIGNHDFHERGNIYGQFLRSIGPLNHAFTIGKTRFVNIDTAANTLPYSAGLRGHLFKGLQQVDRPISDTVAFTHRPLYDPLENSSHDIGSIGERDWLIESLKSIDAHSLLSGHIHIYDREDFMGIDNIIAGQGLGHQDIITQSDYSKMVIGNVDSVGKVSYETQPLSMPMGLHCHPRTQPVKDSLSQGERSDEYAKLLKEIQQACSA